MHFDVTNCASLGKAVHATTASVPFSTLNAPIKLSLIDICTFLFRNGYKFDAWDPVQYGGCQMIINRRLPILSSTHCHYERPFSGPTLLINHVPM